MAKQGTKELGPAYVEAPRKPGPQHGESWHRTVDPLLEKVSALCADRGEALAALNRFTARHPELIEDTDLAIARMLCVARPKGSG